MRALIALLAVAMASPSYATDHGRDKHVKRPAPVVIEQTEHHYAGLLIGAGITYWILRRRAKRAAPPPRSAAAPPSCSCPSPSTEPTVCEASLERVFSSCVTK